MELARINITLIYADPAPKHVALTYTDLVHIYNSYIKPDILGFRV